MSASVTVVVEGDTDIPIARKVVAAVGLQVAGEPIDCGGKDQLDRNLEGYNAAAGYSPWLVLRDLDDAECAPTLVRQLLATPSALMCLRVPVRSIEAWVLADDEAVARFLRVSKGKIPSKPDRLARPKQELVNLARRSRKPAIIADMVPAAGMSRSVGPNYTGRLIELGSRYWSVERARENSESLARALAALQRLEKRLRSEIG